MTAATVPWSAAARLAETLAADALAAAGRSEAAYRAIAPARDAMYAAEHAHRAAKVDADERAAMPRELARALGWPLGIIAEAQDDRAYDGPSWSYRTAFAGGRVTRAPIKYHGTPKGRAYGWIRTPNGGRDDAYTYEPAAGTNNPEKLAAQVDDATRNLKAWLSGHTADAWLVAHNLDPQTRPPLVSLVAVTVDALPHNGDRARWYRPLWTLTLAGYEIARTDDRRAILTPEEERAHGYAGVDAALGAVTSDTPEAVIEYAVRHAERARTALLRAFEYTPDPR